jgi:hypothetical protein
VRVRPRARPQRNAQATARTVEGRRRRSRARCPVGRHESPITPGSQRARSATSRVWPRIRGESRPRSPRLPEPSRARPHSRRALRIPAPIRGTLPPQPDADRGRYRALLAERALSADHQRRSRKGWRARAAWCALFGPLITQQLLVAERAWPRPAVPASAANSCPAGQIGRFGERTHGFGS